jgi:hypothetical protein
MPKEEVEDFLTEDPEISSQKIVLLSFLSPEKILANKDLFMFQQFMKDYDFQWRTSKLEAWMAGQLLEINQRLEKIAGKLDTQDLSGAAQDVRGNLLKVDRFVEDFQEHCRKNSKEIKTSDLQQEFDTFMFKNANKLEDDFFAQNEFRTTIRGIKVRGVFGSEAEASARAKRLQKSDPNFNIYMGSVGKWMAWDPDPSRVPNQEYANDQLNTLMKKYRENEEGREQFFTEQKTRRIGEATRQGEQPAFGEAKVKKEDSDAPAVSDTPFSTGAAAGSFDGLFSETGDLALRRKMEKKE